MGPKIKTNNFYFCLILFLGALIAVSCSTTPLLEEAQKSYDEVMNDSIVVSKAPAPLMDAKDHLDLIVNLKRNGAGDDLINHHAYLAEQKVAIAKETAELNITRDKVERAEKERQVVMKEYQEAAALVAQRRAEQARLDAEEAKRQADLMAQKISELEAEKTERGLALTLKNVVFATGKATLNPGSKQFLVNLVEFLKSYPERGVLIEGFTDNIGSEKVNLDLSQRRADAVKKTLVAMGIDSGRIQTKGYGEQYTVADNNTPEGRQLNRRVEIVISDEGGTLTARQPAQ
jgi:outer membrane protein OmpA-like peptidoglycan-associated protein